MTATFSIVYTYMHTYGRTNKYSKEFVFVDYILPIYEAILWQMVKCIALRVSDMADIRLKWQTLERQQSY